MEWWYPWQPLCEGGKHNFTWTGSSIKPYAPPPDYVPCLCGRMMLVDGMLEETNPFYKPRDEPPKPEEPC